MAALQKELHDRDVAVSAAKAREETMRELQRSVTLPLLPMQAPESMLETDTAAERPPQRAASERSLMASARSRPPRPPLPSAEVSQRTLAPSPASRRNRSALPKTDTSHGERAPRDASPTSQHNGNESPEASRRASRGRPPAEDTRRKSSWRQRLSNSLPRPQVSPPLWRRGKGWKGVDIGMKSTFAL
jgi:hypothetical protein